MTTLLSVPDPSSPGGRLSLDMALVYEAEGRVHEIAYLSPTKGPELMSLFSRASFALGRHTFTLYRAYLQAKKRLANRKAVMVVDQIQPKMKERGLPQNEDTRQAFLDLDAEYSAALSDLNEVEATLEYVRLKARDTEGALNAVKKVLSDTEGMFSRANPNLSVGSVGGEPTPTVTTQPASKPTTQSKSTPTGPLQVGKVNYQF